MIGFFKFKKRGFTLVETLVGVAVFLIISTATYQAYVSLFSLINQNQYKINALNLANEQFEIIRNLPYASVGVQGSIPSGVMPHTQNFTRGNIPFVVTTTVRNIDVPADGLIGGSPSDLSPADNKLVEIEISCPNCKDFSPLSLTTTIAPKGLETASTNGALFVKVFDSNGIPVQGAEVHIENNSVSPAIVIDDVTDNSGMLQIVDAPPGSEAYEITVTKEGYSTDKTYTAGAVGNPSPAKRHATVILQQVTQVSFSIDKLGTLSFSSMTPECVAVGNIDFSLTGLKIIGLNVPKYFANLNTDNSGQYSNDSAEWDFYNVKGIDSNYDIIGINPLNPINLNPDSTQQVSLIVSPKNPKSLVVTVKDSATQLPITGASVKVTDTSGYDQTKVTGRGAIYQTDWSGGSGQESFIDVTRYQSDNGNMDIDNPNGELKLTDDGFGSYNPAGTLESSIIDTGSESNFYNLTWSPTDQPVGTGAGSVKLQFASSMSSSTSVWEYKGPDGTSSTYYTAPDSPLASVHNGDRYARYKIYLSTSDLAFTPNISDVAFTVTSDCTPPGQVVFSGLSTNTYQVEVSMAGYTTQIVSVNVNSDWQESEIYLAP